MNINQLTNVSLWDRLFHWKNVAFQIQHEFDLISELRIKIEQLEQDNKRISHERDSLFTQSVDVIKEHARIRDKFETQKEGNRTLLAFLKEAHIETSGIRPRN